MNEENERHPDMTPPSIIMDKSKAVIIFFSRIMSVNAHQIPIKHPAKMKDKHLSISPVTL